MAVNPEKNRKYYHKCSNNFAVDCILVEEQVGILKDMVGNGFKGKSFKKDSAMEIKKSSHHNVCETFFFAKQRYCQKIKYLHVEIFWIILSILQVKVRCTLCCEKI